MPWNGYNFEDSILISERIVRDDVFTSIHIEEFETMARDTKLGPEEITRDIPNVGEENLKNLDEAGIVYIGAEVNAGDILVGKVTPKGETPMTPEEKLLRAIFGEKAADVRDTSLRVPPGVTGTIVEVRVFNRHGVDKDQRAWRSKGRRRTSGRRPRRRTRDPGAQHLRAPVGNPAQQDGGVRPQGHGGGHQDHAERAGHDRRASMVADRSAQRKGDGRDRRRCASSMTTPSQRLDKRFADKVEKLRRGDELAPGVMKMVKVFVAVKRKLQPGDKMAGRHGNKGVISRIVPIEDMPHLEDGTRGRRRAQSVGRAVAHERRPDSGNPSGLGLCGPRPPDRRALDKVKRDGKYEPLRRHAQARLCQ